MLTVLRCTTPHDPTALLAIGEAMNALEPGVSQPRARGDGIACELSRASDWGDHLAAIGRFLTRHEASIRRAAGLGAVDIDVALGPEDLGARPWRSLGLPPVLAARIGALGVAFVVTVYAGDQNR